MAATIKPKIEGATQVKKTTASKLIFKINKPVEKKVFELLQEMAEKESKRTGIKIILMPYSCEVK